MRYNFSMALVTNRLYHLVFAAAAVVLFLSASDQAAKSVPDEKDDAFLRGATLDIMLGSIDGKDAATKQKIIRRIAVFNDKSAIGRMISILLDPREEDDTRREAAKAAMALGGEVNYAPLLKLLTGDPFVCPKNIRALLEISDRRFIEPLGKFSSLDYIDNQCRVEATKGYLKILGTEDKSPDFRPLLGTKGELSLISIAGDGSSYYRTKAIFLLGRIKSKRSVDTLLKNLSSRNYDVKEASIKALGAIRDKKSIKPLGELLAKEPSVTVTEECVAALIAIGDDDSVSEIERAYAKESLAGKGNILKSLKAMKDRKPKDLFSKLLNGEKDPKVRKQLEEKIKEDSWF